MFEDLWDHHPAPGSERTKELEAGSGQVTQQVEQFFDRITDKTVPAVISAYENRIKPLKERRIVPADKIATSGHALDRCDETARAEFDAFERLSDRDRYRIEDGATAPHGPLWPLR